MVSFEAHGSVGKLPRLSASLTALVPLSTLLSLTSFDDLCGVSHFTLVAGLLDAEIHQLEGLNYARPSLSLFPVYNFPLVTDNSTCPAIQIHGVWFQVNPVHASSEKAPMADEKTLQLLQAENAALLLQIAELQAQLEQAKAAVSTTTPSAPQKVAPTEQSATLTKPKETSITASVPASNGASLAGRTSKAHVEPNSGDNSPTKTQEEALALRKSSSSPTTSAIASPVASSRSRVESVITLQLPAATIAQATPISPKKPSSAHSTPRSPKVVELSVTTVVNGTSAHTTKDEATDFDWKQAPGEGFGEIWCADYAFTAADGNEASIDIADKVSIVNKIDSNWWVVLVIRTGQFGLVPVNHLSPSPP